MQEELWRKEFVLMTSSMYNNREYRVYKVTFWKLYRTGYIYSSVYYIIALPDLTIYYI